MPIIYFMIFFFFNQKTAYEMRISDWSSDVCSSDLAIAQRMKKLASKPVLSAIIKHVMISDITQDIKVANVRLTYLGLIRIRSEERRVGKECVSTCRSRW